MKIDRSKKARKWMLRYKMRYGLSEPYKTLVEPLLLRYSLAKRCFLRVYIPKALQGKSSICVTKCTLNWLRTKGGEENSSALYSTRSLERIDCGHDQNNPLLPRDCILNLLQNESKEKKRHFCVAAQDRELRSAVKRMGTVPLLCFLTSSNLDNASTFTPSSIRSLILTKPAIPNQPRKQEQHKEKPTQEKKEQEEEKKPKINKILALHAGNVLKDLERLRDKALQVQKKSQPIPPAKRQKLDSDAQQ